MLLNFRRARFAPNIFSRQNGCFESKSKMHRAYSLMVLDEYNDHGPKVQAKSGFSLLAKQLTKKN